MNDKLNSFIDELKLPISVREATKEKYSSNSSLPAPTEVKRMIKMSSNDGRKAAIILWEDDLVTVISTDKDREPNISSSNSPDMYHIAQKHYTDLGLVIDYEEDERTIGG